MSASEVSGFGAASVPRRERWPDRCWSRRAIVATAERLQATQNHHPTYESRISAEDQNSPACLMVRAQVWQTSFASPTFSEIEDHADYADAGIMPTSLGVRSQPGLKLSA